MTQTETEILNAIGSRPQCAVSTNGHSAQIAYTKPNGVKIYSVWLGRSRTANNLMEILDTIDGRPLRVNATWSA
jgi:hypothetical protein